MNVYKVCAKIVSFFQISSFFANSLSFMAFFRDNFIILCSIFDFII